MNAPDVVLLWETPEQPPTVFSATSAFYDLDQVPTLLFHLCRAGDRAQPPTGWLYTTTGARPLDPVLAAMWSHPDVVALRDVPGGGAQYTEENLAIQKAAAARLRQMWAAYLAETR